MFTPDYQPPVGASAVFSGRWLRYEPAPGYYRHWEGYRGTLTGWWNNLGRASSRSPGHAPPVKDTK